MRLTPLLAADFAALMAPFAPFENRPELAAAISGGRDSLALALLAHDWVRQRQGRLVGLIVDHGLRPQSAAEAETTRALLDGMGIEAEILRWSGAKPRRGIQQAAREARYRLLFQACGQRGILHLLVAHHADDQSETIAMRAARDSGADGLAGMAALLEQPQARLLRPLLAVPRERLTATLQALRVNWIDDPSNDDPRFERVRVRGKAATPIEVWHRAGDSRAAHEKALAKAAVELLEFESAGGAAIDRSLYARLGEDQQRRLLSRLVQALGGGHHPPRRARLIQAAARLSQGGDRGKSGKSQDFTLFGCRLMLRQVRQSRRTRWNVGPESGRNESKNRAQPLIPAAFFACGPAGAHHLDS